MKIITKNIDDKDDEAPDMETMECIVKESRTMFLEILRKHIPDFSVAHMGLALALLLSSLISAFDDEKEGCGFLDNIYLITQKMLSRGHQRKKPLKSNPFIIQE